MELAAQPVFTVVAQPQGKSSPQLSAVRTFSVNLVQECDQPTATSGTLSLTMYFTNAPFRGILSAITLSGTNANLFRIVSPTSAPAIIPIQGLPIIIGFSSNTAGTYVAQLTILTSDSTGMPIGDTLVVNYTAVRRGGKKTFQVLQPILDFGIVQPNTTATRTFDYMRNTGTEPLEWVFAVNPSPEFTIVNTNPAPVPIIQPFTSSAFFLVKQLPNEILSLTIRFNGRQMGTMISLPLSGVERVCNIPQDATLRATTQPVSVREQNNTAGLRTAIFPTQPNPASDRTTLRFVLAEPSTVTLRVYSALGIEVQAIAARQYEKGEHLVEFDTANLPQGVYFCTLQTPKQSLTQTLTILH